MQTDLFYLDDNGIFPNSPLPLVVYGGAYRTRSVVEIEQCFTKAAWPAAWRSSIFSFHHYHSTAHEVLACFKGSAVLQFGGETGPQVTVDVGDTVIIPAGVAHRCVTSLDGFCMVGAYPTGQPFDTCYGKASERPGVDRNIAAVALPTCDPFTGEVLSESPLGQAWS